MSTDDPLDGTPPQDPLLETALAVADAATIDWARLRREQPADSRTVRSLEALAEIATAHAAADDPEEGTLADVPVRFRWGRLEVRRRLGEGSSGEVWAAWDPRLHREVALKLRREGGLASAWLREARRLAQLRHPNVVTVHGADEHDDRAGLWMDLLHGRTLEELLSVIGPFSAREAAAIGIDLCAALAAVHAAGLVHGDIKTRNVMREGSPGHADGAGRIVLMDFGSTRESSADGAETTYGTPLFTAPEVLGGARPSPASDLYGLGVVLHRLVTGRFPVEASSLRELKAKLANGETVPLRALRPDLPPAFVTVIERALAAEPAARPADAAAMERALQAALGLESVPSRRRLLGRRGAGRLLAAAAALAVIALAATAFVGPRWARPWLARPDRTAFPSVRMVRDWSGDDLAGHFGSSIVALGDWNGDGVPDFAVGAAEERSERGRVHVLSGAADTSGARLAIFTGEAPGNLFGTAMSAAGDLDGDGHRDLVIGAPGDDPANGRAGSVYLYRGGPAFADRPPMVLRGARAGQDFGFKVGIAGDLDGDGYADLLVGAPTDDVAGLNSGRVYLYRGGPAVDDRADLEFSLGIEGAQFGAGGVKGIGDFNADGHDDFAVGASYAPDPGPRAGRLLIYFGGPGLDATPDVVMRGVGVDDFFGDLWPGGDVNGDGHPDLVVGAVRADGDATESGTATIFFGGPRPDGRPDLVLRGESSSAFFGRWCDATTDFDGDGFNDVLVGAPGQCAGTDSSGAVYLYRGGRSIDDVPDLVLRGTATRTGFGTWPTAVGDLSGDGLPDLVIASPIDSRRLKSAGSVRLFDGARFHLVRPRPDTAWTGQSSLAVEWLGSARADVAWSADGGRRWTTAKRRVGGAADNTLTVELPPAARSTDAIRVRVSASDGALAGRGAEAVLRRRSTGGAAPP